MHINTKCSILWLGRQFTGDNAHDIDNYAPRTNDDDIGSFATILNELKLHALGLFVVLTLFAVKCKLISDSFHNTPFRK